MDIVLWGTLHPNVMSEYLVPEARWGRVKASLITCKTRLERISRPGVLLGDSMADSLEDLIKHLGRHSHEVHEGYGVLMTELDKKLVIQAELS